MMVVACAWNNFSGGSTLQDLVMVFYASDGAAKPSEG
jgi:hypothetical protein